MDKPTSPVMDLPEEEFIRLLQVEIACTIAQNEGGRLRTKTSIQLWHYLRVLKGLKPLADMLNDTFFDAKALSTLGVKGISQDLYLRMAKEITNHTSKG